MPRWPRPPLAVIAGDGATEEVTPMASYLGSAIGPRQGPWWPAGQIGGGDTGNRWHGLRAWRMGAPSDH
ncbi:hypothetical protein E2562_035689 [Oryza meyeriana var. granulata]|uniref:Uncharacterized protein n=1 Tax=Oryza meyeriana var. granulata TaxID=110450 RepID=A0A6G1CWS2_9ORYZ|nr:hypothetical protein E2562_035689 [Oryza meyeriana var. granulata]